MKIPYSDIGTLQVFLIDKISYLSIKYDDLKKENDKLNFMDRNIQPRLIRDDIKKCRLLLYAIRLLGRDESNINNKFLILENDDLEFLNKIEY